MSQSLGEQRAAIHGALQANAGPEELDGALLTAWVAVCEWMSPDGKRWLTRIDGEATTAWLRQGLLYDALNGDWDLDEADEEDE